MGNIKKNSCWYHLSGNNHLIILQLWVPLKRIPDASQLTVKLLPSRLTSIYWDSSLARRLWEARQKNELIHNSTSRAWDQSQVNKILLAYFRRDPPSISLLFSSNYRSIFSLSFLDVIFFSPHSPALSTLFGLLSRVFTHVNSQQPGRVFATKGSVHMKKSLTSARLVRDTNMVAVSLFRDVKLIWLLLMSMKTLNLRSGVLF